MKTEIDKTKLSTAEIRTIIRALQIYADPIRYLLAMHDDVFIGLSSSKRNF